jgi:FixJ family two-component response regulator
MKMFIGMSVCVNGSPESVIYFVGDGGLLTELSQTLLVKRGYRLCRFATARQLLDALDRPCSGWLVAQFELPDMDAAALITQLRQRNILIGVIVVGKAELASAVAALRAGALDYIEQPVTDMALLARLGNYL